MLFVRFSNTRPCILLIDTGILLLNELPSK
uniref:Uncharacterized protein n=1 Tax=Arundo donax TaxID=35708 RepID=A0A0A9ARI1_ARUDO